MFLSIKDVCETEAEGFTLFVIHHVAFMALTFIFNGLIICLPLLLSLVFQSYIASVEGGTEPSFKWTVDDKPYFTYYNCMLNIIYQNAAVYKLTVTGFHWTQTSLCKGLTDSISLATDPSLIS